MEIDYFEDRNKQPIFQSFPGDPNKLLCATPSPTKGTSVVQVVDMELGNVYTVNINQDVHDVAMSSDQKVAFVTPAGEVQIHSVKNPAHWTKVCSFKTTLQGAKIAWMSSTGYWIVYTPTTANYQIVNESGESIKEVQHNDDKWRLLALSDDGTDAAQLVYRPYRRGTLHRVNLLTNETTCLIIDTEDSADDLTDLKYITGTDWISWKRMGTEKFALFMYNLKTGERYWTPTSCGPRLSYGGTMLLTTEGKSSMKVHDLYSDQRRELSFDEHVEAAEWTYLKDSDGHMTELIVARFRYSGHHISIAVIDPNSGKVLAEVYNTDSNDSDQWQLKHVLADGRTLVFRDTTNWDSCFMMVWNLY